MLVKGAPGSYNERGDINETHLFTTCLHSHLLLSEAFFPGIILEAETAYFTSNCQDLTPEEQQQVKEEFAVILNEQGVCMKSKSDVKGPVSI